MSSKFWFYLTFQNLSNYDDYKKVGISKWAAILISLVSNAIAALSAFVSAIYFQVHIAIALFIMVFVRAFACFVILSALKGRGVSQA